MAEEARPYVRYSVVQVTTYEVRRSFIDPTVNLTASMLRSARAFEPKGCYDNAETAHAVAYALCAEEHCKSGEPPDSAAFVYPGAVGGTAVPHVHPVQDEASWNAGFRAGLLGAGRPTLEEVQSMTAAGVQQAVRTMRENKLRRE